MFSYKVFFKTFCMLAFLNLFLNFFACGSTYKQRSYIFRKDTFLADVDVKVGWFEDRENKLFFKQKKIDMQETNICLHGNIVHFWISIEKKFIFKFDQEEIISGKISLRCGDHFDRDNSDFYCDLIGSQGNKIVSKKLVVDMNLIEQ